MKTLQIGMGWFPEESGGLNRYYYGSSRHLPKAGVDIEALITGSEQIVNTTNTTQQQIQIFAPTQAPL